MLDPKASGTAGSPDPLPDPDEHPRGTLAIVLAFGVIFALGWFGVYAWIFLERGAPTP